MRDAIKRRVTTEPRATSDLWAIAAYFNPLGYRRRRENFIHFRRRLDIPLVFVELGFGDDFELSESDADVLVQIRGGDVMWQKERLLNIGLRAVPVDCRHVAWIDCDVIFLDPDWPARALRRLEAFSYVQLFDYVYYMPAHVPIGAGRPDLAERRRTGLAFAVESGILPSEAFDLSAHHSIGPYATGMACAARRELVERHGFFDSCIIGGGDTAMIGACYDCFDCVEDRLKMSDRRIEHYRAWGRPFAEAAGGSAGAIGASILHLWHGAVEDRCLRERHEGLRQYGFDPTEDLAGADGEAWRWKSDKPELHDYVRRHFSRRREDG